MRITIEQIVGSNYEFLTQTFDEAFTQFKTILGRSNTILDDYKEYIKYRLKTKFKTIKKFQSLYDLETSRDMFVELIVDYVPKFVSSGVVESLIMNESWVDFNAIGGSKIVNQKEYENRGQNSQQATNTQITGYQGYSISNQDGQYNKNTSTSTGSGNHTSNMSGNESVIKTGEKRLEYIQFLKNFTINTMDSFINQLKKDMIQLVY